MPDIEPDHTYRRYLMTAKRGLRVPRPRCRGVFS
jgi:hypothetical protein